MKRSKYRILAFLPKPDGPAFKRLGIVKDQFDLMPLILQQRIISLTQVGKQLLIIFREDFNKIRWEYTNPRPYSSGAKIDRMAEIIKQTSPKLLVCFGLQAQHAYYRISRHYTAVPRHYYMQFYCPTNRTSEVELVSIRDKILFHNSNFSKE